jgi:hypothetical protein
MLCDSSQGGISYKANLPDVLVMIPHEAEVGRHCAKTFPSGKGRDLDNEAGEISGFFNVWVDRFRELHKVALLERGLWSHVQNGVRSVEGVFNHEMLLPYQFRPTMPLFTSVTQIGALKTNQNCQDLKDMSNFAATGAWIVKSPAA